MIELVAADDHRFAAYLAEPQGTAKGGVVIVHEIFGLTDQMRRFADTLAASGYRCIVPAMFDRVEPGLVVDYADFKRGGQAAMSIEIPALLADLDAARRAVEVDGKAAVAGFCWGGTVAYMGACGQPFACAVSWYGGGIHGLVGRMQPKVPVMYHFGADDAFIPGSAIDEIRAADPDGMFYVYAAAGHGFCCDDREGFNAEAAERSLERSMAFLEAHL